MKLKQTAAALSMFCLVPLASACGQQKVATHIPIPADRMDCAAVEGGRPVVLPEYVIDWSKVTTVEGAKQEYQAYVARLRSRENVIAGYIVKLEDRVFVCADDAQWLREYEASLAKKER